MKNEQPLSAQQISQFITTKFPNIGALSIIVEDSLPSTNDYLLEKITVSRSGDPLPITAVLAEMQTGGKGRQGRTWVSPPGNIYMSLYWPFNGTIEKLYGLSLVVGIAVARVLKANDLYDVQLKWPNDIMWHGRKLGGILIETKQGRTGFVDVVIGIGLNIVEILEYTAEISQQFVSLETALQRKVSRNKLVAQLLDELVKILDLFAKQEFGAFMQEWKIFDSKITSTSLMSTSDAKILSAFNIFHSND